MCLLTVTDSNCNGSSYEPGAFKGLASSFTLKKYDASPVKVNAIGGLRSTIGAYNFYLKTSLAQVIYSVSGQQIFTEQW